MLNLNLRERKKTEIIKDEKSKKLFRKASFRMKVVGKSQTQPAKRNQYFLTLEVIDFAVQQYTRVDEESQDIKELSDIFERKVTKRQYSRFGLGDYLNVRLYRANRGTNWYFTYSSLKNKKPTKSGLELRL
jgi:hypothetical protein